MTCICAGCINDTKEVRKVPARPKKFGAAALPASQQPKSKPKAKTTAEEVSPLAGVYSEYQKDPAFDHLRKQANFVPGSGTTTLPRLIIVGEAPGATEDEVGKPFVGKSGELLDEVLGDSFLDREWLFITNVIKYRPPGNRTPTDEEVDAARPYLKKELGIVGAKRPGGKRPIICLMGKTAGLLLGKQHGLKRGEVTVRKSWRYAYLYHPAVALYDPNMKPTLIQHFRAITQDI